MSKILTGFAGIFRAPALSDQARPTFRRHLLFTVLDGASAGILGNVPLMAVKGLAAKDWQLTVPLGMSCIGMFVALYSGAAMARRGKMSFVVLPGILFSCASLAMVITRKPLFFLMLFGMGTVFEMVTRPAFTAIIRTNYLATERGLAMGTLRQWSSLVYLAANMSSAYVLDAFKSAPYTVIRWEVILAGTLSLAAYLCFSSIRVQEPPGTAQDESPKLRLRTVFEPLTILHRDARFRRYLIGSFIFGLSGLFYVSILPAVFAKDMHLGYVRAALLLHVVPSIAAFLATARLGTWFDRTNTLEAWVIVRLGWGLDPLLLAAAAAWHSFLAFPLALLARTSRGAVQGGSYVLWWQTGVHHFAPPGSDTTRYMGVLVFTNGFMRLFAALIAAEVLAHFSRITILEIGGAGVLVAAVHAHLQARHERGVAALQTIDDFEKSHLNAETPDSSLADHGAVLDPSSYSVPPEIAETPPV